ncbi:hypothetical protein LDENG_00077430 [Lucifuga dentata]|nr:hypothetical protein LDENG_00077430 [Lucifuga dentata]
METTGLYSLLYYFILHSPFLICANAAFTEVPKDVSVGEGEDVEMPCAFKAVSSAPMSLEIQWWYLKEAVPKDLPHELQISSPSSPASRAKIVPREATKISTVRVQGNAISHRLSLSREFTVHGALHVTPGDGMVAEEAVSHIQNRWPLRNTNAEFGGGAGRATSEPGLTGGQRLGQGKPRVPQQAQPGLLPSISSTTASVAKSSASPLPGNAAILRQQHGAGCGVMSTMDPLLFMALLFLHKLLPFLLAH